MPRDCLLVTDLILQLLGVRELVRRLLLMLVLMLLLRRIEYSLTVLLTLEVKRSLALNLYLTLMLMVSHVVSRIGRRLCTFRGNRSNSGALLQVVWVVWQMRFLSWSVNKILILKFPSAL